MSLYYQYWVIFHWFPLSEPADPGLHSGEGQGTGHPEEDAEPDRGPPETGLYLQVLPKCYTHFISLYSLKQGYIMHTDTAKVKMQIVIINEFTQMT